MNDIIKEQISNYFKEYYQKNKERILKKRKEHANKNKERILNYKKEYYYKNREKMKRYNKKYQQTSKGKYHIYKMRTNYKSLIFDITFKEFEDIINKPCYYCGKEGYGVDRVNNSKGYIKGNCVSCCKMCNYMKKDFDFDDFIEQCKIIAENLDDQ